MGAKAAKATYVYCAVQALRKPNLGKAPSGPPGLGTHRLLDAGQGLWLVVADAPPARFGEASIQRGLHDLKWLSRCAVAHEAVVEHFVRARAVIPMKLFTIFESDSRALTEIASKRRQLDRSIRHVAGGREWGVRIRAVPSPVAARPARPPGKIETGASYLAAKKQARDTTRERAERGRARVERAFTALATLAVDVRRHPPPPGGAQSTRLLLDAAFLVRNPVAARFRTATRQLARDLRDDGYGVEVTGPWPPYNFIEP
jgi:hypothetical protein